MEEKQIQENMEQKAEDMDLRGLLTEWKAAEEERKEYARKQFYLSAVTAVCALLILGIILSAYLTIVPRAKTAIDEIQTVSKDFGTVSNKLAKVDIEKLVGHVDEMAVTSEQNMQEAMEKINEIDIDGLNAAIKGLSDVVTPFARFMNRFN